jgi:hypothetical protein
VATIEVNFIEAVTVTGTPQLALNIGGTLVQANYVSGSGGTKLTFKYTVQAGQNDANGISIDANALTLNGGTIQDVHGNNAILNTPPVADNASFKVDTVNLRTVSADGMDKNFSQADDTSDTWVVYSDGTTKGNNLYVTVAGTESLQQAQMRIDGGAWTNMTLSGNKAVFHFNTALTAGDHAFDFRTLDLAGNFSAQRHHRHHLYRQRAQRLHWPGLVGQRQRSNLHAEQSGHWQLPQQRRRQPVFARRHHRGCRFGHGGGPPDADGRRCGVEPDRFARRWLHGRQGPGL